MARSVPRGSFDENITTHDGVDMSVVSWKDNKQVILLSTYVGITQVGISCPKLVSEYNARAELI